MFMLAALLIPVIGGIAVYAMPVSERTRNILCAACVFLTDLTAVYAAVKGGSPVELGQLSEGVRFSFRSDTLGNCFLAVVLILYTCILFYAFEYMKMEERRPLFYAFYMISMGALIAECFSANLVTMYLSFEFLTLSSMPLVLHERTKEAVAAGLKYLFYSIAGAMMGLLAVFFVYAFTGESSQFAFGGILDTAKVTGNEMILLAAVMAGIVGFGAKAGMAVIRLVYFSVGTQLLRGTWVQYAWMCLALLTIFMGSMMAFREKIFKKRLAYSTISQLSYVMLGLSLMSEDGLKGGLLHVFSHAGSKACLFMMAGVFIYKLRVRRTDELTGVGKVMPLALGCFTAASISLVGIPPMGGFTSKWAIASAAIRSGTGSFAVIGPVMLLISALLTAGYLLPIMVDGYFPGGGASYTKEEYAEPNALMLVPMFILCVASLLVGLFGSTFAGSLVF